jgi:5-methylcytosine-specific restriction endonuclease McrA
VTRIAVLLALALALTASAQAAPRDPSVRAAFRKAQPCPSTALHRGACPGYQIDHVHALMLGGRDELANLQWLPVAEHRAKTRAEFAQCKAAPTCAHRAIARKRARQ